MRTRAEVAGGRRRKPEPYAEIGRLSFMYGYTYSIWLAYVIQDSQLERISTKLYGDDGSRFEHLPFLNLTQNLICLVFLLIALKVRPRRSRGYSGSRAGIINTIGPAMGIEALKYMSYASQILVKSSKMIPVILLEIIAYGRRYSFHEYACTFLVAGGASTLVLSKASSKTISRVYHPNAPFGYGICFLNLAFDGLTNNATQDSLVGRFPMSIAWDILLGMNLWGTIYYMIYMFGWPQASGYEAVRFCLEHPEAAWDILVYALLGFWLQGYILLCSYYSPLALTTTQKFASIVISSLLMNHSVFVKQCVSFLMMFCGLLYYLLLKWRKCSRYL